VIGGLGGFEGADGVNPILLQIWVGDADRQWLQPHYVDRSIRPLGVIKSVVPATPDAPDSLLDACLAFYPLHFEQCPSLAEAALLLEDATHLNFHLDRLNVPVIWRALRKEAKPHFRRLNIFEGVLRRIKASEVSPT
jgi:hypothetical protein